MATGSCFCGKIKIQLTSQPLQSGLCHCLDCRKLTGSFCSYSYVVKSSDVIVTGGTPKEVAKTADSGNSVRNYFCPDCGSPLFGRRIEADGNFAAITIMRAGIFDNEELLNERGPEAELFTDRRLKWVHPVEGTAQVSGMLKLS